MIYPDPTIPFYLWTDASGTRLGACLMQEDQKLPKRPLRPVGFASRTLKERETRYTPNELEGLAIIYGLQYFKYMIQGCDIVVVTDHSALKHIMDRKVIKSNRMLHWRVEIADFETLGGSLRFVYNKGAQNHVADALSRGAIDPLELTEAEEELWVASRALLSDPLDSEIPTCAKVKTTATLEKEFHFLDTESIAKALEIGNLRIIILKL
ncbi:ribonuclease H family protein, partial [Pseudoalteromonas sp.]|uniref:Ty3/Gypsy family RNase HI domain-containing protein n=1 Tax=Pseudoalteromonas sp. TaxID=53249 RepID=UPI002622CD03